MRCIESSFALLKNWQVLFFGAVFVAATGTGFAGKVEFVGDPSASIAPEIAEVAAELAAIDAEIAKQKGVVAKQQAKVAALDKELAAVMVVPEVAAPEASEGDADAEAAEATEPLTVEEEAAAAAEEQVERSFWSFLSGSAATREEQVAKLEAKLASANEALAAEKATLEELVASREAPAKTEAQLKVKAEYLEGKLGARLSEMKLNEYQSSLEPLKESLVVTREKVRAQTSVVSELRASPDVTSEELAAAEAELRRLETEAMTVDRTLDHNTYGIRVALRESEQYNLQAERSYQQMFELGTNQSGLPTVDQLVEAEMMTRDAILKAAQQKPTSEKVMDALKWPFVKIGEGAKSGYCWVVGCVTSCCGCESESACESDEG